MTRFALYERTSQFQISSYATRLGLIFLDKIYPTQDNPLEIIWTNEDKSSTFHYVEDEWIGVRYIALTGSHNEHLGSIIKKEKIIDIYLWEDMLRDYSNATEIEQVSYASMLAILSPEQFTPDAFECFKTFLANENPTVRQKAVLSTSYRPWPQFKPILSKIKEHDQNDFVRWRAEVVLQAFAQSGI